jgi:undecaprenyl-diphosphatase
MMREIMLGLLQGFTEFFPISSSGHLAIIQHFFPGANQQEDVIFDILLHLATLLVVLIYYRHDLITIIKTIFWSIRKKEMRSGEQAILERKMLPLLIVASIPTGMIGVLVKLSGRLEEMFSALPMIGIALLVTGTLLYLAEARGSSNPKHAISYLDALIIGIIQGIAVLPGISRSGATISTGILRGIERKLVTTFSFLLSIPAVLGAIVLEGKEIITLSYTPQFIAYLIGMFAAFVSGYIAIIALIRLVLNKKLFWFAGYCWAVGGLVLLYSLVK